MTRHEAGTLQNDDRNSAHDHSGSSGAPEIVVNGFWERLRQGNGYAPAMSASAVRLLYCGDLRTGPRLLRDSGHEVVVLASGVSADQLAAIAVQEDVAVVAVDDADLGADAVPALDEDVVVFSITSDSGPS